MPVERESWAFNSIINAVCFTQSRCSCTHTNLLNDTDAHQKQHASTKAGSSVFNIKQTETTRSQTRTPAAVLLTAPNQMIVNECLALVNEMNLICWWLLIFISHITYYCFTSPYTHNSNSGIHSAALPGVPDPLLLSERDGEIQTCLGIIFTRVGGALLHFWHLVEMYRRDSLCTIFTLLPLSFCLSLIQSFLRSHFSVVSMATSPRPLLARWHTFWFSLSFIHCFSFSLCVLPIIFIILTITCFDSLCLKVQVSCFLILWYYTIGN